MNSFTRSLANSPVENNRCAATPFGCGRPINVSAEFSDELSKKEYQISGLCQKCQNSVFCDEQEQYSDDAEDWERDQLSMDGND